MFVGSQELWYFAFVKALPSSCALAVVRGEFRSKKRSLFWVSLAMQWVLLGCVVFCALLAQGVMKAEGKPLQCCLGMGTARSGEVTVLHVYIHEFL